MLINCDWSQDRDYKTGSINEPIEFYLEGLKNSNKFDLLLGYFSSAAISLLSLGFASFISNGGKMRIVINHLLSEGDKNALISGENNPDITRVFDLNDVARLSRILSDYDKHFFECLAYLIAQKRIEFKVIRPAAGKGIAHYKSGVFFDGISYVGYKASCNFTLYGLSENLEELEAFLSWENGRSNKLIKKQLRLIDSYFSESEADVNYLNSDQIEIAINDHFGGKEVNQLLVQERDLISRRKELYKNEKVKLSLNRLERQIQEKLNNPGFPYPSGPRDYQVEAFEQWQRNGNNGIFSMATGTGKTITALNCVLSLFNSSGIYRAVIVVPTISLIDQWLKECENFNFNNIIKISSRTEWQEDMNFFISAANYIKSSFIIIVTYASFVKKKFQLEFARLPDDTVFVADEAHNLGSPVLLSILPKIHLQKRIGLSATPYRNYDEEGNLAIEKFFNDQPPYLVNFPMSKALELGWLCNYIYFPHVVRLTEEEQLEYTKISKQLAKFIDPDKGSFIMSEVVERLLLKRKRIIHKASNKKLVFEDIMKCEFEKRGNLLYTLVYVPEGLEPDVSSIDTDDESLEGQQLIDDYTRIVSKVDDSIFVKKFTASSKSRWTMLKDFEDGRLHVLTSMKCLDEGIDVPRSELAIFCSSTGNPRQFIQRRGRVLRIHPDKRMATIHDLVVVPMVDSKDSSYEMERNLVRGELIRVADFSRLALNSMESRDSLLDVLNFYNFTLSDL